MIRVSSLRFILNEIRFNGYRTLRRSVNDMCVWRLIEYAQAVSMLRLRSDDRVLDIGPGTSLFPLALAQGGARVTAAERDPARADWQHRKALHAGRSLPGNVRVVHCDGRNLPFAQDSFTKVVSVSTIEHIEDDRSVPWRSPGSWPLAGWP
jgi:SAM-dependent methyltransferase